jgi:hypothetical protein
LHSKLILFGSIFSYSNSLLDWAQDPDEKLREDELEEERKEGLAEKEDLQSLRKQREWDDWKDGIIFIIINICSLQLLFIIN